MSWPCTPCTPKLDHAIGEMLPEWFRSLPGTEGEAKATTATATSSLETKNPKPSRHRKDAKEKKTDCPALEEMSEWFRKEPEPKATQSLEFAPKKDTRDKSDKTFERMEPSDFDQAREMAKRIFTASKTVLEQSHQEFLQLLNSLDGQGRESTCSPDSAQLSEESLVSTVSTDAGSDERPGESPEKHWKRDLRTSRRKVPVSPGLVTRESCMGCLYPKPPKEKMQEGADREAKMQEKLTSSDLSDSQDTPEKTQQTVPMTQHTLTRGLRDGGRVRIRITPQHFSSLGTAFRDVQVDFEPNSFTVRALDREGYSWTAFSKTLPGPIAVDRCKFKIDPYGKEVAINLWLIDESWSLNRIELERPYTLNKESCEKFKLDNFI